MSATKKTIDEITTTLSTVTGAERLPGRDGSGDFKTLISSIYTYFKNRIIDTDATLAANSDKVASSQKALKTYISAQIAAATGMPIGSVGVWPVASDIPSDWVEQDGSAISRTTYSALFAIVGTTFGVGDGSTTFNIPDTETNGDFIRHFKSGISEAIGTHQADQFQGHAIEFADTGGGFNFPIEVGSYGAGANAAITAGGTATVDKQQWTSDGVNGTPRTGTTTYPVNNAFIYIIKIS